MMKIAAISQRVDEVKEYGEKRDALDEQRQSKEKFELINCKIRELIESKAEDYIQVPYTTRIWMAQAREYKQQRQ